MYKIFFSKKTKKKPRLAEKFLSHCPISKTHNLISRKKKVGAAEYGKRTNSLSLQKIRQINEIFCQNGMRANLHICLLRVIYCSKNLPFTCIFSTNSVILLRDSKCCLNNWDDPRWLPQTLYMVMVVWSSSISFLNTCSLVLDL